MSTAEDESGRLFRIRRTALQMLRDRNYLVIPEVEINITKAQFLEKFGEGFTREDLTISKAKKDDPSDQIYVFFPIEVKVGIQQIRKFIERMKTDNVKRAILVVRQNMTPSAKTFIQAAYEKYQMEVFLEAELLVNIKDHNLVPEHEVLTEEEKRTLLGRYTLKETQLPRMQVTDPIAKYYGLRRGQVVKIIRPSETAGRYITYRYVI